MKILIICSKRFYGNIPNIKDELEQKNIQVFLPNCYDDPKTEERMWDLGKDKHQEFKAKMYKQSENTIKNMDAVLVLNFDKITDEKIDKNYTKIFQRKNLYDIILVSNCEITVSELF